MLENAHNLEKMISKNMEIILSSKQTTGYFDIFSNNSQPDLARSLLVYWTLARVWRLFPTKIDKGELEVGVSNLKKNISLLSDPVDKKFSHIYFILFQLEIHVNVESEVKEFVDNEFAVIFSNPLLCSFFVTVLLESGFSNDPHLRSLLNTCLNVIEYNLNIEESDKDLHQYVEVSKWKQYLGQDFDYLYKKVSEKTLGAFYKYHSVNTSCLAASLEHFALSGDLDNYKKVFAQIETRGYPKTGILSDPKLCDKEYLFVEIPNSTVTCLDINTHLLASLIELYENAN